MAGKIRVSLPGSLGATCIAPKINEFCQQYPDVLIEVEFGDRRISLAHWNIDVAIRIGAQTDLDYVARPIFRVYHLVCATPQYWAKHGMPKHPDELSQHVALRQSWLPNPEQWPYWTSSDNRESIQVPIRVLSGSGTYLREASLAGLGVSCQPTFLIAGDIAAGRLQPALTEYTWSRINAFLLTRKTSLLTHRARLFSNFLAEEFKGGTPWDDQIQALLPR